MSMVDCPRCGCLVSGEVAELSRHLRLDLAYAAFRCALCHSHFLDYRDALAHFKKGDTMHPKQTPKILEIPDQKLEDQIWSLIQSVQEPKPKLAELQPLQEPENSGELSDESETEEAPEEAAEEAPGESPPSPVYYVNKHGCPSPVKESREDSFLNPDPNEDRLLTPSPTKSEFDQRLSEIDQESQPEEAENVPEPKPKRQRVKSPKSKSPKKKSKSKHSPVSLKSKSPKSKPSPTNHGQTMSHSESMGIRILKGKNGVKVRCELCAKEVPSIYLHRHISTVHLKRPTYACRLCDYKNTEWANQRIRHHIAKDHLGVPDIYEQVEDLREGLREAIDSALLECFPSIVTRDVIMS